MTQKLDLRLSDTGDYFNATALTNQRNANTLQPAKRNTDFIHGQRNAQAIELIEDAFYLAGSHEFRAMWMHRALLPHFLYWLDREILILLYEGAPVPPPCEIDSLGDRMLG